MFSFYFENCSFLLQKVLVLHSEGWWSFLLTFFTFFTFLIKNSVLLVWYEACFGPYEKFDFRNVWLPQVVHCDRLCILLRSKYWIIIDDWMIDYDMDDRTWINVFVSFTGSPGGHSGGLDPTGEGRRPQVLRAGTHTHTRVLEYYYCYCFYCTVILQESIDPNIHKDIQVQQPLTCWPALT